MPQQEENRENFLKEFHHRYPACTAQAFVNGRTDQGISSYEWLARTARDLPAGSAVLDLACGDGFLLSLLSQSRGSSLKLMGLDMSAAEIKLARARCPVGVELWEARAQEMPIADGALDLVVSHMALMVMDHLDQVVNEITRVLKVGGRFAAVVGSGLLPDPAAEIFRRVIGDALARENQTMMDFGDVRTRSDEGLRAVFSSRQFASPVEVQNDVLNFDCDAEAMTDFFLLTYPSGQLSVEGREQLAEDLRREFSELGGAQGRFKQRIQLRHLIARRL